MLDLRRSLITRLSGRWLLVIAWMALIFFLSAQPSPPRAPDELLDVLLKKGAHFGEYLVLAILLARALSQGSGATSLRARAGALSLAIAYAISDELHQRFVSGRGPSPQDVAIDSLGAIAGLAVLTLLNRRAEHDPRPSS